MTFKVGDGVRVKPHVRQNGGISFGTIDRVGYTNDCLYVKGENGKILPFNDKELELVQQAPAKRPSEVILEKLIEAKRAFQEVRSRRVALEEEERVLAEKVGLCEAQLKNAINKEASHSG